jgi:transcription antitermination factor NusG
MVGDCKLPWYALKVRAKCEATVDATLQRKSYETFLPTYQECRQYSDRRKVVSVPMFPGYLFCRMDVENRLPILKTPGVDFVLGNGRPESIPEHEIEAVERTISSGLTARPWPFLKVGQRVLVEDGPLTGVQGLLLAEKGIKRLILSVEMLARSVSVELDRAAIRPL